MSGPQQQVLVVGPSWVGDMVMAHTLVSLLVRHRNASVYMVAPPATEPLTRRMPGVSGSWVMNLGHGELGLKTRRRLARTLKGEAFDQAIVLPNSFKSALLPYWAGIPRRTG